MNVEQLVKLKLAGETEVLSENLHQCGFIKSSRVKNIELFWRILFQGWSEWGKKGKAYWPNSKGK
jgi:hypothetical protein